MSRICCYATTAFAERAIDYLPDHAIQFADRPFFLYLAFISPHFPLHALRYMMKLRLLNSFQQIDWGQIHGRLDTNNTHLVVRGVRSEQRLEELREQEGIWLTEHHYFVVARIRNSLYIIDAYLHLILRFEHRDDYFNQMYFHHLERPTFRYDVRPEETAGCTTMDNVDENDDDPLGGIEGHGLKGKPQTHIVERGKRKQKA